MTKKTSKTRVKKSTPKYEVLKGSEVVLTTADFEKAREKVKELKASNIECIFLRSCEEGFQEVYSKGRYEKNYRIRVEKFTPEEPVPELPVENQEPNMGLETQETE